MSLDRNEFNTNDELKDVEGANVGLQAPWVTLWWLVRTMFKYDPAIKVEDINYGDNGQYSADIIVKDEEKAAALNDVLSKVNEIGNITFTFNIFANMNKQGDSNGVVELEDYKKLFAKNPVVFDFLDLTDSFGNKHQFVVFTREVASFYNDDATNPWGLWNGLYEDIASKIFNGSNIMFTTAPDNIDDYEYAIKNLVE